MDVKSIPFKNLVGKSFTLFDGTKADIYMYFNADPEPIFLIKRRGGKKLAQVGALELIQILKHSELKNL